MQALYATPAWACYLIVKFCRTEGYCTKKWGRISPGFYWYHQKQSSYVVRRLATSPIFDQSEAEKLSHTDKHRINILSGPALRAAPAKKTAPDRLAETISSSKTQANRHRGGTSCKIVSSAKFGHWRYYLWLDEIDCNLGQQSKSHDQQVEVVQR